MENYIITEGEFDAELLKKLIPAKFLKSVRFIHAGAYSSALSVTKTLLSKPENQLINILLVLDADTNDMVKIKEKYNFIQHYVSGDFENLKIILIIPNIESILFESKDFLERVTHTQISILDLEVGKRNPRETIEKLSINNTNKLLDHLTSSDIEIMSNHLTIKEIITGLKEVQPARIT